VEAAAGIRAETGDFFDQVADASEEHQAESQEAIDRLSEEAQRAAEAVRRF